MQVLQYVITDQEVMTHARAYRARPRSEKLSAADAVEINPGKRCQPVHKSLGAVLNLKRHNLWVHQPKIRNRAMSQTSQRHSANYDISDLTTLEFGIVGYTERITSSPLSDPLN